MKCLKVRRELQHVFVNQMRNQWDLSQSISIHKSPQITQCAHQSQHRYDLRSINCAIN